MPIGAFIKAGTNTQGKQPMVPSSAKSSWHVCHDNAETAQGEVDAPHDIPDDVFHWVQVPESATKVLVRGRIPLASTVATSPIVKVLGVNGKIAEAGSFDDAPTGASYGVFTRLDTTDWNGTGVTVELETANVCVDDTYDWGNVTDNDGYDLLGCEYVGLLVVTPADISAGSPELLVKFI